MKLTARQIERLVKQGEIVHTECKEASGKKKKGKWVYYTPSCSTVVYPTDGSAADPENFTGEVNYYFAPNANGFPGVGETVGVGVGY